MPFFPASDLMSKAPLPLVARCGSCKLYKSCHSPKMPVAGRGRRRVLIVGEQPGRNEDQQGEPFVGPTGQLLRETLDQFGVDLREDCWLTNALICYSDDKVSNNKMIDWCRPNLVKAVERLKPDVIIPLGARAVQSVIGWLWKEDVGPISRWVGWQIPVQKINAWVCPTWHPAALLRSEDKNKAVMEMLFARHLKSAFALEGRPWKKVPDYGSKVQKIFDPTEAASVIEQLTGGDRPVAIDIETDRLKPDADDARIVSCAVSDGKTTISYPWGGEAVKATKMFLLSKVRKIGYNFKFESRWFKSKLGVWPRNWAQDGMILSHVLDNRKGITSLKFQAFVLLGVDSWDDSIKPYLKSVNEGGNEKNRIHEIGLDRLLFYGGLDALLEWKVAVVQAEQLGEKLCTI